MSLVLRGSVGMLAWVGDRAREPVDIDWVVRSDQVVARDDLDPYPYLDRIDQAQIWPEIAHGAGRGQMWTFEDFDTGGMHPLLPPEGLHWLSEEESRQWRSEGNQRLTEFREVDDVIDLVRASPQAADGTILDAAAVRRTDLGGDYDVAGGVRLVFPWRAADGLSGTLQTDFAYDETLPEPPVLATVPGGAGRPPVTVWAANPFVSLAWKLRWLGDDQLTKGISAGKDLYDAVLLAELVGTGMSRRVRRATLDRLDDRGVLVPDMVRTWRVEWESFQHEHPWVRGDAAEWLERLAATLR